METESGTIYCIPNEPEDIEEDGYEFYKRLVVEQNYTTKIGEIDIIAKTNDIIVFVEVKDRQTKRFGMPREAVTAYKQNKIRKVAMQYLVAKHLTESRVRFDCVEILGDTITHIENAF